MLDRKDDNAEAADVVGSPEPRNAPSSLSRRNALIGAGTIAGFGLAAAGAAQAQSYADAKKGDTNGSASNPGPNNVALDALNKDSVDSPPTDHGTVPQTWQSFSLSHRRIQDGGWARQINVTDFPISKDIAAVNMKLNAGGIRELHWHAANEWALMLTGSARITVVDDAAHPAVKDVKAGDLWYFPTGLPHSIQGLGPDGCEFLLVFDQGSFNEDETTLITDWLIHTPREVVAKNFGVSQETLKPFNDLPSAGKWIFQAPVPPALSQDVASATRNVPATKNVYDFAMMDMKPDKQNAMGVIRIVDSTKFKVSKNIAMAHVTVKPGAMRELHWHQNADEWQYYIAGTGRMTVFANHTNARTMDFRAGDVGYIPITLPHYIENTGSDDLVFLEMFKTPVYQDISLNNWIASLPVELVAQHLDLSEKTIESLPKDDIGILPKTV